MVVNEKADRQHAIASALELPIAWAKKVDYYNLGVQKSLPEFSKYALQQDEFSKCVFH